MNRTFIDDEKARSLVPPGMDDNYIIDKVHDLESITEIKQLGSSVNRYENLDDLFRRSAQIDPEAMPAFLPTLECFKDPALYEEMSQRGLSKEFRRLLGSLPNDSLMSKVDGRLVVKYGSPVRAKAEYSQDSELMIFDLDRSSKKKGLFISHGLRVYSDGSVLNGNEMLPTGSEVYFKDLSWIWKLLRPVTASGIIASTTYLGEGKNMNIEIVKLGKMPYEEILYHEGSHIYDHYNRKSHPTSEYAGNLFINSLNTYLNLSMLIAILGFTPNLLYIAALANLTGYAFSRRPNNPIGKAHHNTIASEVLAYSRPEDLTRILISKGFPVAPDSHKVRVNEQSLAINYQPYIWAFIDMIRLAMKQNKSFQPQPALSY